MATELENGKEWAHRAAEAVARELGMCGNIEWGSPSNRTFLALVLKAGDSLTEIMKIDQVQLERSTYDFELQNGLRSKIRSAVMDAHLKE
jgi:hypothetical protein